MAENPLVTALKLMRRALELVDQAGSVQDVGGHLDLAIAKLADTLGEAGLESGNDNYLTVEPDQTLPEPSNSQK